MKKTWNKMKEAWQQFWESDAYAAEKKHLSQSDRRWLLYWNFITCIAMLSLVTLITGMNSYLVNRKNNESAEEVFNMIAAYMASATEDESSEIAENLRHELVFSEFGTDRENFIEYIPNTAECCSTCMESYTARMFLVCTNTGQLYPLDLYEDGDGLDEHEPITRMTFGYDEVSRTSLYISKSPNQGKGCAEIDYGGGIVSVHRMKTLFCDDCIRSILNAVEHQPVMEFVLFDTKEEVFYPIDSGTTVQIGNYRLEIEYKNGDYEIMIEAV
jgi:hypothetical protein